MPAFATATRKAEDLVLTAIPEDERLWVPQAERIWFRPLFLNTVSGEWVNLLRVRRAGVLSRHRHPAQFHRHLRQRPAPASGRACPTRTA